MHMSLRDESGRKLIFTLLFIIILVTVNLFLQIVLVARPSRCTSSSSRYTTNASVGFRHGRMYRIQSVLDGTNLDLADANTASGTTINTWENNYHAAQKWIVNQESQGFRIASVMSTGDSLKVIDMRRDTLLWFNTFHAGTNQLFYTESCGSNKFLIRTYFENLAMRNQGKGTQVKCFPANCTDIAQQWLLVEG